MVLAFPGKNEEQQSKLQACHSTPQQDFKKLQKYLANDTNAASACFAPGHCLDDVDCFVQLARCQDLSIVQMWGAQDWQKRVLAHVSRPKMSKVCWHLKTSQDISRLKTWFGASLDGWSLHYVMHTINGFRPFGLGLDSHPHPFPEFARVCQKGHHEERKRMSTDLSFKRDTITFQPCSAHFMGKTTQSFGLVSSKVFWEDFRLQEKISWRFL